MCHFVTLIVPSSDQAAVRTVMERHGRTAYAIKNSSVGKVLKDDERQYLTNRRGCDCGTVLAPERSEESDVDDQVSDATRMARKGWSKAKIGRALLDRQKTQARTHVGPDSFELWSAALTDLINAMGASHAGLMVHSYSGDIENEAFETRREEAPKNLTLIEALASMKENTVTIFRVV